MESEGGMTSAEKIWDLLRRVHYPGLERNVVDLGYVTEVGLEVDQWVIRLDLKTSDTAAATAMEQEIHERLDEAGIRHRVLLSPSPAAQHAARTEDLAPTVRHKILVASAKGGVGKSTVAANLALALAQTGGRTGLLDADVYGPSIPLMLGATDRRPDSRGAKLLPIELHGLQTMSLGFLVEGLDPIIWRGPLASRALEQLLSDVDWGPLDYLVIDMPPGTGDIQISVAQKSNPSGAVVVTTPQDVALTDAIRGVRMFRKVKIPVLGLVENMSYFECPHCHKPSEIFPRGSLRLELERLEVPILARIPLDPAVATGGDAGTPILITAPRSAAAIALRQLGEQVARQLERVHPRGTSTAETK
jgi:ATP-binding protein involved in chromosome partitioning